MSDVTSDVPMVAAMVATRDVRWGTKRVVWRVVMMDCSRVVLLDRTVVALTVGTMVLIAVAWLVAL